MDREDTQKKVLLEDLYKPTPEIQERIFDVYEKYIRWKSLRDSNYKQFNGSNLVDYISEARQKYWGYIPLTDTTDDDKKFFFPETRNQINQILARMANMKMKPSFEGVEHFDIMKSTLLKDLFEYWRRGENRKMNNFWQFLYTVINGTCITFVGYNNNVRKVKNVKYHDAETGETKFSEQDIDDSDVEEIICNLEDIYLPKIWEPSIQLQGELIWRTLFKWSDFKQSFKGYQDSRFVMPGMQFADTSIFSQFLSYDIRGGDFVEVIKYFNKNTDEYMIIANGVLLNPIKEKNKYSICPLPWNHKELPFASKILEPIDASFFYGMPIGQKVKDPQTALNKFWELMFEREVRSISKPIITNDNIEDLNLEFKSGNVYKVNTDVNQYKELDVAPNTGSTWNMVNSLQNIIKATAGGGSGVAIPTRQPRSATEKAADEMQRKEQSGLHYFFFEDFMSQKVWLIIQNMIQFYTSHKVESVVGGKKYRKLLSLVDVELVNGGMGNREIRITDKPTSPKDLQKETWERSMLTKERVEIIEVTPDEMRRVKFDIKIGFEEEMSPQNEKALYIDYIKTLYSLFGPIGLLDMKKLLFRTVEKFGDNPADVMPDQLMQEYEMDRFGIQGRAVAQPMATPAVRDAQQPDRGMQFGVGGPAATQSAMMDKSPLMKIAKLKT